jgi:hypothetical protein
MTPNDLAYRVAIGRELQDAPSPRPPDPSECAPLPAGVELGTRCMPVIDWERTSHGELRPRLAEMPPFDDHRDFAPLPRADVIVMTWTSEEWDSLHYVFSNELHPLPEAPSDNMEWRQHWRPYRRDMYRVYPDLWSRRLIGQAENMGGGTPSLNRGVQRWGSYTVVTVGDKRILLFKSDMHLNQDGERLPVATMTRQIVLEVQPTLVLSIGTGGGLDPETQILGDAVVTNAARFRLNAEFSNAAFNDREYRSGYVPPDAARAIAAPLMMPVPEFPVHPMTGHFGDARPLQPAEGGRTPEVIIDPRPILTTDFFEFGTTENKLEEHGCVVEMGDAVNGMIIDELNAQPDRDGPEVRYGFVRNVSDPVINGRLPEALQSAWAVTTYYKRGVHTSYNGAIATWALIAAEATGAEG